MESALIATENHREYLQESLVWLCKLLRPNNVESLLAEIERGERELERLRQREEKHRDRGILVIDHLVVADMRGKIERLEDKLGLLKEEHDQYVVPWQNAINFIGQVEKDTHLPVIP